MSGLTARWNQSPKSMSQWGTEKSRRLQTTSRSFCYVFGKLLSRIPNNLAEENPRKNKAKIKEWILSNIPRFEKWEGLNEEVND